MILDLNKHIGNFEADALRNQLLAIDNLEVQLGTRNLTTIDEGLKSILCCAKELKKVQLEKILDVEFEKNWTGDFSGDWL